MNGPIKKFGDAALARQVIDAFVQGDVALVKFVCADLGVGIEQNPDEEEALRDKAKEARKEIEEGIL